MSNARSHPLSWVKKTVTVEPYEAPSFEQNDQWQLIAVTSGPRGTELTFGWPWPSSSEDKE